jgi:hypothetical protein
MRARGFAFQRRTIAKAALPLAALVQYLDRRASVQLGLKPETTLRKWST